MDDQRNRNEDPAARALGWVSLALAVPALVAPDRVARAIGLRPDERALAALRGVGVQEAAAGLGLLRGRRAHGWVRTRVLGDLAHLGLLASASDEAEDPERVRATACALVGFALVDALAARRIGRAARSPRRRELRVRATVTVNRPADEVFARWRRLGELPAFMAHVEAVEELDDRRSRWTVVGPAGKRFSWEAEIVEERGGELLVWRSLADADVQSAGRVELRPAPGGRGTEVAVELAYVPPAGRLGAAVAKLLGEAPEQQVADDLRRFKQVVETGEVLRSSGTPEGSVTKRQLRQKPAQPA